MLAVSLLSVTPVRGLALQHPHSIELGEHGPIEDRRYTLLTDAGTARSVIGPWVEALSDYA